jgi:hypothetical protein
VFDFLHNEQAVAAAVPVQMPLVCQLFRGLPAVTDFVTTCKHPCNSFYYITHWLAAHPAGR